jgi:hypothetical protein
MTSGEELNVCETLRDVQSRSGQRVLVRGIYQQVDSRMRRKSPPLYSGRVAIQLEDGTNVLLEPSWSPKGIRNQEERARYDGKHVEAVGVVYAAAPKPVKPVAYITGPCLSPVEEVRMAAIGRS